MFSFKIKDYLIVAIIRMPFGFLAPKEILNYLVFQSFEFQRTRWRLFQKPSTLILIFTSLFQIYHCQFWLFCLGPLVYLLPRTLKFDFSISYHLKRLENSNDFLMLYIYIYCFLPLLYRSYNSNVEIRIQFVSKFYTVQYIL